MFSSAKRASINFQSTAAAVLFFYSCVIKPLRNVLNSPQFFAIRSFFPNSECTPLIVIYI